MTDDRPAVLRVVSGNPSPEELAALTAVVAAGSSDSPPSDAPPVRGRWNDPAAQHRRPWQAGPGGWRAAAR